MTQIMQLALRLPELTNRSERLDAMASDLPERSRRRKSVEKRASAVFRQAVSLDTKIMAKTPKSVEDAVTQLAIARDYAQMAETAIDPADKSGREDMAKVRGVIDRVTAFLAAEIDFDLSSIGSEPFGA